MLPAATSLLSLVCCMALSPSLFCFCCLYLLCLPLYSASAASPSILLLLCLSLFCFCFYSASAASSPLPHYPVYMFPGQDKLSGEQTNKQTLISSLKTLNEQIVHLETVLSNNNKDNNTNNNKDSPSNNNKDNASTNSASNNTNTNTNTSSSNKLSLKQQIEQLNGRLQELQKVYIYALA